MALLIRIHGVRCVHPGSQFREVVGAECVLQIESATDVLQEAEQQLGFILCGALGYTRAKENDGQESSDTDQYIQQFGGHTVETLCSLACQPFGRFVDAK